MARSQRQQLGDQYETLALEFLCAAGLSPIARNYSSRTGEIDLIMREDDVIVFTEVRYRTGSGFGTAAATVTPAKQRKIFRTAEHFVQTHREAQHSPLRFDVIAIDRDGNSTGPESDHIQWLRDAFRP